MKKILVTGGAGFIGSKLAKKLIEDGYEVIVIDILLEKIHGNNPVFTSDLYRSIYSDVEFVNVSILDREKIEEVIGYCDAVVHLAAETGTGESMYDIYNYANVNILGTSLLLDIIVNRKNKITKLIVASSRAIYGEGMYICSEHGLVFPGIRSDIDLRKGLFECKCPVCDNIVSLIPTSESCKIQPASVYAISKYAQEELVMVTGKSIGLPVVALRYQNVYGPGQSLSNPYTGILSIFSTQIKNNNDINIFEDGEESRDFVYIDDVVTATKLCIEKDEANNNIYNVGSSNAVSVLDVAKKLKKYYKSEVEINITGRYRLGDIRHNVADISKIYSDLGFVPKYGFDRGVELFCDWVNKQEVKNDNYSLSIAELVKRGLYK